MSLTSFGLSFASHLADFASRFFLFEIIKIITCFSRFEFCFETYAWYIFSFLAYKTLRAIVTLFFSIFFQSSFSDGKLIPSQLYLFINGLIFLILCENFLISSWLNVTGTSYWKYFLHLFNFFYWWDSLLFFIQSRESVNDPPLFVFILRHLPYNKWT